MKDKTQLREKIHQAVCEMYTSVSRDPNQPYHFPVGRKAAEFVGYLPAVLDQLPKSAVESFAGVGCHFYTKAIQAGHTVLDIGSGSGTDMLIAAQLVGPMGNVIGVDITDAMLEKAHQAITEAHLTNVAVQKIDGEALPFANETFDVVISNGVINLIPDKAQVFAEAYRVLKADGVLSIADIVLGKPISEKSRENPRLWAECIVGALPEEEYLDLIQRSGFHDVSVISPLDYFSGSNTPSTREVANHYRAHSIVVKAIKK